MKRVALALVAAVSCAGLLAAAQEPPAPFKLGTFERDGRSFVGIVLRESAVVEFPAATDMKDLIARYEQLRPQIREAVRTGNPVDIKTLKILPPVRPQTILAMAVNYKDHDIEMNTVGASGRTALGGTTTQVTGGAAPAGTRSAPGIWERAGGDERWNPYMFLKSPAAIIAHGEAIRMPPQRTNIDWECELGVVIGPVADHVAPARAGDHIFGYTLMNDVSDRGGRGDMRFGSDWLLMKNHPTFAPLGPFITPKEFIPDPKKMQVRFTLNGQLMQDANTSYMIHDVFEQVVYASNILPLQPGDIISTGSPAGVGSARTPPIFLKPGDRSVCTYEGVGTLINTVVGPAAARN